MGFFLFVLVNAVLFLRPSELLPELASLRLYEALIIGCFACSFMDVVNQLMPAELAANPITCGVLIIWFCFGMSLIILPDVAAGIELFVNFGKVIIYYLLLVTLVNSPWRLRMFLYALTFFIALQTLVAVLRYTEVIVITVPPSLKTSPDRVERFDEKRDDGSKPYVEDGYFDDRVGEEVVLRRLRGTGLFNDPNDLCLALVLGILVCIYALFEMGFSADRLSQAPLAPFLTGALSLFPLGLFLAAMRMTYSRGGLLGLLAGLGMLFWCRYGWRKSLALGVLALPVMLALFGGRMTSMSVGEGTGQSRIQLWRDGIVEFKLSPLLGVGVNQYQEYAGQVAHNSYIHAFTELGFLGGAAFLGMFFYVFWALERMGRVHILDGDMRRLRPFIMAMMTGFAFGILSLSRCYEVPTYTMFGIAAAFLRVTQVYPPLDLRLSGVLAASVFAVSVLFLLAMYVLVRVVAA